MVDTGYVPGVCNIGPAEIRRRRNLGWVALVVTVIAYGMLVWVDVNPWWRLFLFVPAMVSASGFLQAHFRFCAGFSRAGVFNFGALGATHKVADEADRRSDRRRGNQISLYATLIGAAVAIVAVFVG